MAPVPSCCVFAFAGVLAALPAAAAPPAGVVPRPDAGRAVQQIDPSVLNRGDAAHTNFVPSLSCKGVCVSSGCLPEFRNTGKLAIAEGSTLAFTVTPDPKAMEYALSLPKPLAPGESWRTLAVFDRIDSCKARIR